MSQVNSPPLPGTVEHRNSLRKKSNYFVLAALVLYIGSVVAMYTLEDTFHVLGPVIAVVWLVAIGCWFVGLGYYCLSKGWSVVFAALGIFTVLGLLVLRLLKDRYQVTSPPEGGHYPRPPITPA